MSTVVLNADLLAGLKQAVLAASVVMLCLWSGAVALAAHGSKTGR
jgi:hypothetical protein